MAYLNGFFKVNAPMAQYYGLSPNEIAHLLHTSVTGEKVGKIDRGEEVVDLYVTSGNRLQNRYLTHLTRSDGATLPLSMLGDFVERTSADSVRRFNGDRYVTVTAEVDEKVLPLFQTHRRIEDLIDEKILSPGVSFEQRGEYSDTQKSLDSMIRSAVVAFGLAFLILTMLFRSLTQPIIVLLVIPLAYMGVVWGMTLTAQPLTLMGFIGVVGPHWNSYQ